jgi:hypothetical protein
MTGGPILPSSIFVGNAAGNAYPIFYTPNTNTNTAGYIEGVGVVASLGADAPVTLQFNLPESIPAGTLKLRTLAMANSTSNSAILTIADAGTAVGSNIGATTLTTDVSSHSITWTTADVLVEYKLALTGSGVNTANNIATVLVTFNHTSWTLAVQSVWQFSLVWE